MDSLSYSLSAVSPSSLYLLSLFIFIGLILSLTRVYTTLNYHQVLKRNEGLQLDNKQSKPITPVQIPYTLPVLGNALAFLAPYPGQFWHWLFSFHPRSSGICTLLLGGQKAHIIYSPAAVHALFQARGPNRDKFNKQVIIGGFGMAPDQADIFFAPTSAPQEHKMNDKYLMRTDAVNELTARFSEVLRDVLARDAAAAEQMGEVGLFRWLRDRMFTASTTAVYGDRIMTECPGLCEDFFELDANFLSMFFGFPPKLVIPRAYSSRERLLNGLVAWRRKMYEESDGKVADPDDADVPWDPLFGARHARAKEIFFERIGLDARARAVLTAGFLFGLSSNAIPATGWILMHTLDPNGDETLLPRVLDEVKTAQREDGSLDVPRLISLPLLQSIMTEVLRLYTDVLVTRGLPADLTLPLDAEGKRPVILKKHDIIMAPSYLGHYDEAAWGTADVPADRFYAERFLRHDSETGKPAFTMSGTTGKYFPFGGGKTMCPGRVFAKQEVLSAVAMVLLSFEFDVVGFVDERGRSKDRFPGLRKSYLGSGVMNADGELKVRIRRKV